MIFRLLFCKHRNDEKKYLLYLQRELYCLGKGDASPTKILITSSLFLDTLCFQSVVFSLRIVEKAIVMLCLTNTWT